MNTLYLEDHVEKATKIGFTLSDENTFYKEWIVERRNEPIEVDPKRIQSFILGKDYGHQDGLYHFGGCRLWSWKVISETRVLLEVNSTAMTG